MPRFDLFTSIHKALRAMIYETGGALQTADFADKRSAHGAVDALKPVLGQMQHHHDLEEEHVFPKVRPFEEEMIDELQAQHEQVERLLGIAAVAADETSSAVSAARAGAGVDLNRRYNELTALFLEHLAPEIPVIIPHLGALSGGYGPLARAGVWGHPLVYADSAVAGLSEIEDYLSRHGSSRLMFGSDYPFSQPGTELAKILSLGLPEADAQAILGDNFRRLCWMGVR